MSLLGPAVPRSSALLRNSLIPEHSARDHLALAIHTLLARVYLRTGKLDRAIKISQDVIRLLPHRRDELLADARLTRVLANLQSLDVPGAKQDFQWVLDHGDAEHQRFAQSFLAAGKLVEVAETGWDEFGEYGRKRGDLWRNRN